MNDVLFIYFLELNCSLFLKFLTQSCGRGLKIPAVARFRQIHSGMLSIIFTRFSKSLNSENVLYLLWKLIVYNNELRFLVNLTFLTFYFAKKTFYLNSLPKYSQNVFKGSIKFSRPDLTYDNRLMEQCLYI